MNAYKIGVIGLVISTISFSALAQTVTGSKDQREKMPMPATTPYGGMPSPFGPGGVGGSTPEEKAQMLSAFSAVAIDRKAYMEQMMQAFDNMDRNGDGMLGANEMAIAPEEDEDSLMKPIDKDKIEKDKAMRSSASKSIAPLTGQASSSPGIAPLGGK